MKKFFFIVLVLLLVSTAALGGAVQDQIVVKRIAAKVMRLLDDNNVRTRETRLKQLIRQKFAYAQFEQQVLQDVRRKLSLTQKKRFSKVFYALLERKLVSLATGNDAHCDTYSIDSAKTADQVLVTCAQSDTTHEIELKVSGRKISDITFSGARLTRNYRGTINKIVRRDGPDQLLKLLEQKLAGNPNAADVLF